MSPPVRAARRLLRPVQIVALLVSFVVGVAVLAVRLRTVSAQPRTFGAWGRGAGRGPAGAQGAWAAASAEPPEASTSAASAASSGASPPPLDYAEIQDERDFPPDMSLAERDAIGTGKVPIHRDGRYRSPFAHPRFGGPSTAKVGLVMSNLYEYDIQKGNFEADFFVSFTGDRPMPDLTLNFPNGKEVNVTTLADSPTFKLYKVNGKFLSSVDLRKYPFDTQPLDIEIEDLKAGVDQLVLVPDKNRTSLDAGFSVNGWNVSSLSARAYRHRYPPRFDRDDLYISRYRFTLSIDRFGVSAALSVFVPAIVIVLIALTGVWVPPEELEVRSNTGAPMLAAAVLFHYSLIQSLPATGYLTRADKMMMAVYGCLLLNMISTWLFVVVHERWVENVFRWGRVVVPPVCVAVMVASAVL